MQFRIEMETAGAGWLVKITNLTTGQPVLDGGGKPFERTLRSVGEGTRRFPQPPENEANAITESADNPHRELCTSVDPKTIESIYRKLLSRQPDDVVKFGRYLFATLVGDVLWEAINEQAKAQPIELALSWKDDYLINRLPWEMMHGKDRFLAAEPEVAITRRVAGTTQNLTEISAPRVLFVVGSDLAKDDRIKPGAEYLGLLRSLKPGARLRLKTHLLLQASPRRLRAAIKWFNPTVVHFICHGFANPDQETFINLMTDEGGGVERVNAESLLKLLRPDPAAPLPQIVILNACYTAVDNIDLYVKSGQVASPMAAKLVAGDGHDSGVPIVVGMAGEVADQACRLFTRCFYQAILGGGEIAQAAAAGRRVGIIEEGLTDPTSSLDWALPTLFMSAGVTEPRLQIEATPKEERWHEVAMEFAPPPYPAFCGRLDFFEWYDCLMAGNSDDLPAPQQLNGDLQVLAVSLEQKDKKYPDAQLGRTWLLRQFAANAALDGHLPILLNLHWIERPGADYPGTLARLSADFRRAINRTTQLFSLDFRAECLDLVAAVASGAKSAEDLPRDVRDAQGEEGSWEAPLVQFAALRTDLLRLLETARREHSEKERPRTKLLLLIDDVHQMAKATEQLLSFFSSMYGLRSNISVSENGPTARTDIRVVCTYDLSMGLPDAEKAITGWLEFAKGAKQVPLRVFQAPEDRLAYEFFLSRWRDLRGNEMPLALQRKAQLELVNYFFETLANQVEGIPSRLSCKDAQTTIKTFLNMPGAMKVLQVMNDEDRLRLIPTQKRGF